MVKAQSIANRSIDRSIGYVMIFDCRSNYILLYRFAKYVDRLVLNFIVRLLRQRSGCRSAT